MTSGNLFLLAEVLGHSSTKTTKIYAHLMPAHLARARDAVCIPFVTSESADLPESEAEIAQGEPLH